MVLWNLWIGRARHPGPGSAPFLIEVLNFGGWLTHCDFALDVDVDFLAVVEHRLIPAGKQAKHWCTVRFERDPPVRRSHPGRMMGASERQLLCARLWSACVVAYAENGYRWWFCGVVLSGVGTTPRTMSLALSFDLGTALSRSMALSSSSHQNSFAYNLHERLWALVVGSLAGSTSWPRPQSRRSSRCDMPSCCQRLIGRLAIFTRLARIARLTRVAHLYELRAPSLHLWATLSAMSGRACSNEKLVDSVGDMLVDLTRSNLHVVERFLVRNIVDCDGVVCVLVVVSRGRPETLLPGS